MRKLIFTLAFIATMVSTTGAQNKRNAIGFRYGNGGEFTYQRFLGSSNRLEVDLGVNSWNAGSGDTGTCLTGIYQWVWDINKSDAGFKWYLGVGPQFGILKDGNALGALGQLGLEYNFTIPLQLSVDYRPGWYCLPKNFGGSFEDLSVSVRYRF
ncbi:secreted protein [Paludibacter propionicigenes WB4]|uniref:Secreted protein n=1 Tax=Paludibacter propionicigenes (strain DSM 17365 / JCM 13257 / WB4) TaxID=694427 RepID=E4T103_PALPW|nr:hypothetical protein [Paludibacter propionicigenes]ADQ78384.1 secreted protein [Paludibacter propionicigenes WB4]